MLNTSATQVALIDSRDGNPGWIPHKLSVLRTVIQFPCASNCCLLWYSRSGVVADVI